MAVVLVTVFERSNPLAVIGWWITQKVQQPVSVVFMSCQGFFPFTTFISTKVEQIPTVV